MKPHCIASPQNPIIKEIAALRNARQRRKQGRILIDGGRDILRAIEAGWRIEYIVCCETESDENFDAAAATLAANGRVKWIQTTPAAHSRLAYGESTKAVAVVEPRVWSWADVLPEPNGDATVVILDRIEKPGNVGAVLRCCDALNVRGVVLSDGICELYNPNAIRSSTGAIFWLPVLESTAQTAADRLTQAGFSFFAARIDAQAEDYAAVQWGKRRAIIFGSEAEGLGNRWEGSNIRNVMIPMSGRADSLNVSVAAAVVLAEIRRNSA